MRKGGGFGIYVEDNMSFSVCYELTTVEEKFVESIFIKAIFGEKSIICEVIYRTPNLETNANDIFLLSFNTCLSKIPPSCNCVIGVGDFNYNFLNHEDKFVNRFIDSMYENAFCSMINKPIRITDTTTTVLDQIWTNTQFVETHAYILAESVSDHLPVLLCATFASKSTNQKSMIKKRSFSEANQLLFQNKVGGLDISLLQQNEDVNEAFTMLKTEFTKIFHECFPLLPVQIKLLIINGMMMN